MSNKKFKLDINGQTQLMYDLNITFDRMAAELEGIEKDVLNTGAYALKEKVKASLMAKMPAAARPVRNQLYKGKRSSSGYEISTGESLADAVRQTSADLTSKSATVHILGSGKANSPTFMTRFFENGTNPRYSSHLNGKKLKKKRYRGSLKAYQFFAPVITNEIDDAFSLMGRVYENKINKIIENDGQ